MKHKKNIAIGDTVKVKTNKGIKSAEVLKINEATLFVKLPDGNEVKRHKVRHLIVD